MTRHEVELQAQLNRRHIDEDQKTENHVDPATGSIFTFDNDRLCWHKSGNVGFHRLDLAVAGPAAKGLYAT